MIRSADGEELRRGRHPASVEVLLGIPDPQVLENAAARLPEEVRDLAVNGAGRQFGEQEVPRQRELVAPPRRRRSCGIGTRRSLALFFWRESGRISKAKQRIPSRTRTESLRSAAASSGRGPTVNWISGS
jgi:hypothetical protein